MKLFLFFLFSSFEYISIFIMMLILFRQKIRIHLGKIAFLCIFLSLVSHFIRYTLQLNEFAIIVQIITMVASLRYLWNIQWFYSIVMAVISYCAFLAINVLTFILMNSLGLIRLDQLQEADGTGLAYMGYVLQLVTVCMCTVFIVIIRYLNRGWAFVPDGEKDIEYGKKENQQLLIASLIAFIAFGSILFIGNMWGNTTFTISFFVLACILATLFYLATKKDEAEYD
ncbi:hypothetical protein [Brevibacillus reuszeri]|uniref:hypothetical protein n=1 Tax=Brevibacillus reuszeri TaxID=54915 RepID=UPI002897EEDA|nr:hypothetical protein [Brevibacillus reuszeri]